MKRNLIFLAILFLTLGFYSCGSYSNRVPASTNGDPAGPPAVVSVSVSPSNVTLAPNGTQQFNASVQNASDPTVTWAVDGIVNGNSSVGTVSGTGSSITYTAPASTGSHTVVATSAADTTKFASAAVFIAVPPAISVRISPTTASIPADGTQGFTATVTNATNTGVAWTVDDVVNGDSSVGTISGSGDNVTYNAPAQGGSHSVTVTSMADTSKFASAKVTVLSSSANFPSSNHVFVVMEENQNFSKVFPHGSASDCSGSSMPYLCSLAATNGLATEFYSNQHGSLRSYLYNTSGSAWMQSPYSCSGNNCASIGVITNDNLVRALTAAGKTWRGYFEDMPSQGYMGTDVNHYVRRHNPFIWYSDVANSETQQDNMYPFARFSQDLANNEFANFSYIIPNILDDGNGNGGQTAAQLMSQADGWLRSKLAPLLTTSLFQPGGDGILIITFDESNVAGESGDTTTDSSCSPTQSSGCGGHIAFVMIGPSVLPGSTTARVYHFQDMLHTMIHLLGLTDFMNGASGAADIDLLAGVSP